MATGFNEPLLRAIKGETNLLLLSIVTGAKRKLNLPEGRGCSIVKVSCRSYALPPIMPRRSGPKRRNSRGDHRRPSPIAEFEDLMPWRSAMRQASLNRPRLSAYTRPAATTD